MNKLTTYRTVIFCLAGIAVFLLVFYFFFIRHLIPETVSGEGPVWFENFINTFYPRFSSEKSRFSGNFFIAKADMVIIRATALLLGVSLIGFLNTYSLKFRRNFDRFWVKETSVSTINSLRILYFIFLILFLADLFPSVKNLPNLSGLYQPHLFFRLFGPKVPSGFILQIFWWLSIITAALAVFNIKPVISAAVSVFLFILIQGYVYSFGKLDHTYATFTYAGMLMPFLLAEKRKAVGNQNVELINSRALKLIMIGIATAYLFSGLEKLTVSGGHWLDPNTLRAHLFSRQTELGIIIAESDFLCIALQTLALIFQLGFILILFIPKSKFIILPVGILFHLGTFLIFGISWYISPWVYAYIFFIDWGKIRLIFLPLQPKKRLS